MDRRGCKCFGGNCSLMLTDSPRVIHRADYLEALMKAASDAGVQFRLNAAVKTVDVAETLVCLESGERVHADAIIGADGELCHLWQGRSANISDV